MLDGDYPFEFTSPEGAAMKESTEASPGPGGSVEVVGPVRSFINKLRKEKRPAVTTSRKRRFLIRATKVLVVIASLWLLAAYVVLPALWRHFEHQPAMEDAPRTSVTAQGIPGDPLNIALIGSEEGLIHAMLASGWKPADPITLRSSARIASSVLLNKSYPDAPVSNLFVFGRKQDLAFDKAEGRSARHRHHVRFWRSEDLGRGGVPLWIGAVTFDRSVGFSHLTGQITHHIGPDIDAERDDLIGDLRKGGWLTELFQVTGVGATLVGRNGGGDRYDTDGELTVGVLVLGETRDHRPEELDNPVAVRVKEQLWTAIRPLLRSLPDQ
jgi:LssY C-terminus